MKDFKIIPKNIFQLYHDKSLVPHSISEYIKDLNKNYNYNFLDFDQALQAIKLGFENNFFEKIKDALEKLPRYCHQSDLLRYCLLYLHGGIYLDVDLKPMTSFESMTPKDINFFSSFGQGGPTLDYVNFKKEKKRVFKITANGLLGSFPNNPILLDFINHCIDNSIDSKPENRGANVFYLYKYFESICSARELTFQPFVKFNQEEVKFYFFNQVQTRLGPNSIINESGNALIDANYYTIARQTSSYI